MPLTRIDSAFLDLDALGGIDFDVQSGIPTLKVDAVNHRIGIGNNSPTQKLDVAGNVNISSGSNYLVNGGQISTANIAENASYLYFTDARATSAITGSALDMGSNNITTTGKVLYSNMYSAEGDLPSASTYHGMFAHVHGTGKGYFAHGGNWIKLLDESGGSIGSLSIDGNVSSTTQFSGFDALRIHNANGSAFGVTADMYFTAGTGSSNRGAAIGSELVSGYGNDLYFATNAGNVSSTNVLTERLRITSAGYLLINTSTSRIIEDHVGNGPQGKIQIEATNSDAIMSIISAGTADANRCGTINLGRHRNSTVGATPTIVNDNDTLGAIVFSGGDGTDMRCVGAKIHAEVDGAPGENDMPGALVFSTTPDGVSGPYQRERLRITSVGEVLISNSGNRFLSLDRTNASTGSGEFNLNVESNSQTTISYDDGAPLVIGTSSSPRTQSGFTERLKITSGGIVRIPDNGKFTAGAGDDLQIYHNGTHNFIDASGSADLYVRGANILFQDHVNSNRNWLIGLANGTLELYHSGNKKLETTSTGVSVTGLLSATTKSFIIDHPTKEGMKLRHGSLEGPENGVYVRGRSCLRAINLPDYWTALVDPNSITVVLTSIGPSGPPRVERIENNKVYVFSEDPRPLDYFYMINAERIDVEPLEVEISE
jgi:hypothetical protein